MDGCNTIVIIFLDVCQMINFLVTLEKTEWVTTKLVFLGILLDGETHVLLISCEHREEILALVHKFIDKKKSIISELQKLAGHLNFINHAVVPDRAFMRHMYSKFSGSSLLSKNGTLLKPHHHIKLDMEFKMDCMMWSSFLSDLSAVNRPFINLDSCLNAKDVGFYSDASANKDLGYGIVFGNNWVSGKWECGFVEQYEPSIEFLELFVLCAGIITYDTCLARTHIIVFCDNMSVVHIVNSLSSSCRQCMKLERLLTLNNMKHDR